MKKDNDENDFDFDELLSDKKDSILEKKYLRYTKNSRSSKSYIQKTREEKILSFSNGFVNGGLYGVAFGLFLGLYFKIRLKFNLKKQFYYKSSLASGFIFGFCFGVYAIFCLENDKIKETFLINIPITVSSNISSSSSSQ